MQVKTRLAEINSFVGYKLRNIHLSGHRVPISRILSEPEYSLKTYMENFNKILFKFFLITFKQLKFLYRAN
jgi:hypothetical protein